MNDRSNVKINIPELTATAKAMVGNHRGLLAADESDGTILSRFNSIKLASTPESRRAYRDMLLTTPDVTKYISGVILYDETLRQKTNGGVSFPAYLAANGMLPGIKVDHGAKPLAGFPEETITDGLDDLRERLTEYHQLGVRFAKWRAVIRIGADLPSDYAVSANAAALARYASLCQEEAIVPIVEPEVLMEGSHTINRCEEVTKFVLRTVFEQLAHAGVLLEGIVLKPNMVTAGKQCPQACLPQQVAEATIRTLKQTVPATVPGIAFLSGGQDPRLATLHLSLMNALLPLPWALTFSYGRALQEDALRTWGGHDEHAKDGQRQFYRRAQLNALAAAGHYQSAMEN